MFSFNDSERLSEALETKWIRRVSGFYRCSSDEKGYFANLEWEPANLFYLDCACDLYKVLTNDERGIAFLGSDRRGMLFNEIAAELESIIISYGKQGSSKNLVPPGSQRNVFTFPSTELCMSREFFAVVGSLSVSEEGRALLDSTCVFTHLSVLGSLQSLDYISRVAITALSFSDGGFMSRHLIQIWTTDFCCSDDLRDYIQSMLLTLLRARPHDFARWGIDALVNQLSNDHEDPSDILFNVTEEVFQDPFLMRDIIGRRPNLSGFTGFPKLQCRMASISEGIDYLNSKNLLNPLLNSWQNGDDDVKYVNEVERAISRSLNRKLNKSVIDPIVVPAVDRSGSRDTEFGQDTGCLQVNVDNKILGGHAIELEGMLRIPWHIEVKLTSQAGVGPSSTVSSGTEYVRVDAFLGNNNDMVS
jgi:rapamycin-insensitive companion of mTOR